MNILFTSSGRRNYLLNYFKKSLGNKGLIYAADMQASAPTMSIADRSITVPPVSDSCYIDYLLNICSEEKITAVISLNDIELPILAAAKNLFDRNKIVLIVSDSNVIDTCFDKWKSFQFAQKTGILTPKTFNSLKSVREGIYNSDLQFPLVLKPRWGSASFGIEFVYTIKELEMAYNLLKIKISRSILAEPSSKDIDRSILIQESIDGIEYGVDILNNFNGDFVCCYVKEKLAMRAGETDKAALRNKPELDRISYIVAKELGHIGNLDCDFFEKDAELYLLEMNPRFGGGYPFSHVAGANYPEAILTWLNNEEYDLKGFKYIYNKAYSKYDNLIEVNF